MKKLAMLTSLLLVLGLSNLAWAGTRVVPYVNVTATYCIGTMSSIDTVDTLSYVRGYGYANNTLYFSCRDEVGAYFSCYVPTGDVHWLQAMHMKESLTEGDLLYIYASASGAQCTNVYTMNASYYQRW